MSERLGVSAQQDAPKYDVWSVFTRFARDYMRPQVPLILAGLFCNALIAGFTSLYPLLIERGVNALDATVSAESPETIPYWGFALAIFLAMGMRSSFTYLGGLALGYAAHRMLIHIQSHLFSHIIHADYEWVVQTHSGRFMSAFLNDAQGIGSAFQAATIDITRNAFILVGLVAYITYSSLWVALSLFIVLPAAAAITRGFGLLTRKSHGVFHQQIAIFSTHIAETLRNMRTIKVYRSEEVEMERVRQVFGNIQRHFGRALKAQNAPSAVIELMTGVSVGAVIFLVGYLSWDVGALGASGTLAGILASLLLAYASIRRIASSYTTIEQGIASALRVFAMLDRQPKIRDKPHAKSLPRERVGIGFHQVYFQYAPESPALHGVSFEIPQGESAALVGMSGAGKSTILNLIPRFYDPDKGSITIGGADIRDVTQKSLRDSLALVTQEPIIFSDTIRHNIAYGRPSATEEEIHEAARDAAAHDFITSLAKGYDTQVGEGGIKLSGGERQRIALARAMLKNAPILLMDEPTSSLDQHSERHIQKALKRLMAGRTTLIIAHRLSTIIHGDRIHVVHQGKIVERGRHEELIGAGSVYAKLYGSSGATDGA